MNISMSKKRTSVAFLLNKRTQNVYNINSRACIGRSKTAEVCFTNSSVSRSHACVQYHAESNTWTITDTAVKHLISQEINNFLDDNIDTIVELYCVITFEKGFWLLTNKGSTLGTKVNNMELLEGEAMQIKHGDEIQIASLEELTFKFGVGKFPPKFRKNDPAIPKINMDDENVDENIGNRHNLQVPQDISVLQIDENKNKIKQLEDNYKVHSERLSNGFESQTFHMDSQSEEYKAMERVFKEALDKLKAEMETQIQNLRLENEELLTRSDIKDKLIMEQNEKLKQAKESVELVEAKYQKEKEEKEEEIKRLKDELKQTQQEIEKKNLEKTEELNSLKEDLKLAVLKKEESDNALLTDYLNKITNCIESEVLCSICSEMMVEVAVVNCGHVFCEKCISEWLKKKSDAPVCPMCRYPVVFKQKCPTFTSLLECLSESVPPFKRKRQEAIDERSAVLRTCEQSTGTSSHPEATGDVFAFPSNIILPSGSGHRTVTGPVDHIDLTLDDSVIVQVIPAGLGLLQNNQQIDLTVAIPDILDPHQYPQDRNETTAARTRRNSIPRSRRGHFRRNSSRRR